MMTAHVSQLSRVLAPQGFRLMQNPLWKYQMLVLTKSISIDALKIAMSSGYTANSDNQSNGSSDI